MAARSISETKRVRYLLGLSSRAERERIESEFFENDDAFQEMLTAEDDLLDAYARGDLTSEERQRFEENFVKSQRNRTLFARAFAETLSPARSVEIKVSDTFKAFPASGMLRSATIAMLLVFVVVLAWLVIDRRKVSNEIRELRAESAALRKQTEALQQSSDTERRQTAEIAAQFANLRMQPDKPIHRERQPIATQPARQLREEKTDHEIVSVKPGEAELLINRSDATLGSTFVNKVITRLPLDVRNVPDLLTLQTATTREGYETPRADQSNITLDGSDIILLNSLNSYSLTPRNTTTSGGETTIRIPRPFSWIRFQLFLETAAIHEEYRLTIRSAAGYPVTSIDWIEPLESRQNFIDTPVIATGDLPSGDYMLSLLGKSETDGSFVKVAEYLFKVIKLY